MASLSSSTLASLLATAPRSSRASRNTIFRTIGNWSVRPLAARHAPQSRCTRTRATMKGRLATLKSECCSRPTTKRLRTRRSGRWSLSGSPSASMNPGAASTASCSLLITSSTTPRRPGLATPSCSNSATTCAARPSGAPGSSTLWSPSFSPGQVPDRDGAVLRRRSVVPSLWHPTRRAWRGLAKFVSTSAAVAGARLFADAGCFLQASNASRAAAVLRFFPTSCTCRATSPRPLAFFGCAAVASPICRTMRLPRQPALAHWPSTRLLRALVPSPCEDR
mmetsp:Transcript_5428/g.17408  ORF Transcript_5428/g.17408 Transcript_5428/m.17408 type:complete len:279 (-) Transcript_5428:6-842(-)